MSRKRRSRDPMIVERKVRFYRIVPAVGYETAPPFEAEEALRRIGSLLPTDDRYHDQGERVTFCVPIRSPSRPTLRIFNVRRTNLPEVEAAGLLSPLELDPQAGLAEPIHLVFFPDQVVGSEFNYHGARPGRLAEYLRAKRIDPQIQVLPLLRDDLVRRLDELQEIKMARIRIRRGDTGLLRREDRELAEVFRQSAEFSSGADIDLTIRRATRRDALTERVRAVIRRLAASADAHEAISALQVEGRNPTTGDWEVLDLLEAELVVTRRFLRVDARSRVLDTSDAIASIESAYEELQDEIIRSATFQPPPP